MTSTHLRLSLFVVCLVAVSVSGVSDPGLSKSCAHTRSTFESITLQDQNGASRSLTGRVFEELQSAMSCTTCQLKDTCCSNDAEKSFKDYIVDHYRDKMLSKLSNPLMACHNHSFFDEFKLYFSAAKDNIVSLMLRAYGIYFQNYLTIFDDFFEYLQTTVDTGNTCRLPEEWNEIFYELFLATYFSDPNLASPADQLPSTDAFRNCFYQIFLDRKGEEVSNTLRGFLRSYNQTMRYMRALRSLDRVIVSTVDLLLGQECQDSIMKMTHCASCAGYVAPTCDGLCLNVMRGCMVDLSDMFEALDNYSDALIRLHSSITRVNGLHYFFSQMDLLASNFFLLVGDTAGSARAIEQIVLSTCDANGRRTKRQASSGNTPRVPRQSVVPPLDALNSSAYCIAGSLSSLKTLPNAVCGDVPTDKAGCWNGNSVGSYERAVFDFDRQSQINNPEMVIKRNQRHFEQQIANLEAITREMNILTGNHECASDDEDESCTVPPTCEYFDIVDAPYTVPEVASGSGSGEGSTSSPRDTPTVDPCAPVTTTVAIEDITTTASVTVSSVSTDAPTTRSTTRVIVNEITDGPSIGGPGEGQTMSPLPGPSIGGPGEGQTESPVPSVGGSAARLTSSLMLVILTLSVLLL